VSEPQTEAELRDENDALRETNLELQEALRGRIEDAGRIRIEEASRIRAEAVLRWLDTEAEGLLAEALQDRSTYEFVPYPFHAVLTTKVYSAAALVSHLRERMTP
jgi:hypothetical protein